MGKYYAVLFTAYIAIQWTSWLQAIVWDSDKYSESKAQAFAQNKTWKIGVGGCSAVKVQKKWIASARHCGAKNSINQDGKTYKVTKNVVHPVSDARLYRVGKKLPSGRVAPRASDLKVGDRFQKIGRGRSGQTSLSGNRGRGVGGFGIWRGGRNEVDVFWSPNRIRYIYDKNYKNEVGTDSGDSGGPATMGNYLVSTTAGSTAIYWFDVDWTRIEGWWQDYL
ncbi:MAG: hypothetical protein AAGA18_11670 [Verrucomicrobiota bacterium]